MKRTSLLILCACLLLLASVPMAMGATCNTAWVSTTAYNGGATVSYNGVNYTAAFWTQGNEPDTNSGAAGSGEPWISNGSCSGGGSTATATATATKTPTATNGCTATAITPYIWTSAGGWQQITSISVGSGTAVDIGPQPSSGGSWSWSGPNGFSSTSREIRQYSAEQRQQHLYRYLHQFLRQQEHDDVYSHRKRRPDGDGNQTPTATAAARLPRSCLIFR